MLFTLRMTVEVQQTRKTSLLQIPVTRKPTRCPCTQLGPPSRGDPRRAVEVAPSVGLRPSLQPVGPAVSTSAG